ncbi:MAG: NAD-dependent epimerase/dehydratase family protein [Spirochaetales bacterium]|nr:NAD-dependent epimerase/dehydratase family protein [Spirochaetales bacterium]
MNGKNVLVAGASGFVGGAVVDRLCASPHHPYRVSCLVRREQAGACLRERHPEVQARIGELGDPDSLYRALEGCDWLLNCAGLNAFWQRISYPLSPGTRVRKASPYYRVNVEGTGNLMRAAARAGVSRVVHVSTVMAYGFPDEMPFGEASCPGPHMSGYARSKFDGDALARELCQGAGLPLTVVYLAAVIGRGDPKAVMQIRSFVRGGIPVLIRSNSLFTYIHVRDAAEAIVRAAEKEDGAEAYLVGGERLSTAEYFGLLSELSGVPVPRWALGRRATMLLSGLLTAWAGLTGRPPLLPLDLMRTQFRGSLLFDDSKARRELGMRYTPVREALREAVAEARDEIAAGTGQVGGAE